MSKTILILGAVLVVLSVVGWYQRLPCPPAANDEVRAAWTAYRAEELDAARSRFQGAARHCPDHLDAHLGLGFTYLRLGEPARARPHFERVLRREPANADALTGAGIAAFHEGEMGPAYRWLAAADRAAPARQDVDAMLARVPEGFGALAWDTLPLRDTLTLTARARGGALELWTGAGWAGIAPRGVDLAPRPAWRRPQEAPDRAHFAALLDRLRADSVNLIRLWTLYPPAFYAALRAHNLAHDPPLLLVQGVTLEAPVPYPGAAAAAAWQQAQYTHLGRVVDALHGRAAPVGALTRTEEGGFTRDVSPWTVALALRLRGGDATLERLDGRGSGTWVGAWFEVHDGAPAELWLARLAHATLSYEAGRYRTLRPVALPRGIRAAAGQGISGLAPGVLAVDALYAY
jgi:tetratricopeptide (TPR) repeat protein